MRDSGDRLRWDLPGPVVDKHSTGGVGDTVSLLLAPLLAAAGAFVPMISGRGLGHTGGTLDKLEAIPGLSTEVAEEHFRRLVHDTGAAIVAASNRMAPADRRLYAMRDVTGTVESVDLITASILSKKLAAGLETLVLDVKVGSGAFMATTEDARALARTLVETANAAGCRTLAFMTDMDQPLAPALGNALEVAVVTDILTGAGVASEYRRFVDLTHRLVGELLAASGLAEDVAAGIARSEELLASGAAAEVFARMIADLGGPTGLLENWKKLLPQAPVQLDVPAASDGQVAVIDGRALGEAVVRLGGGRQRQGDPIDPAVGVSHTLPIGATVTRGTPLARVHAADTEAAEAAVDAVLAAYGIEAVAQPPALVRERIAP